MHCFFLKVFIKKEKMSKGYLYHTLEFFVNFPQQISILIFISSNPNSP